MTAVENVGECGTREQEFVEVVGQTKLIADETGSTSAVRLLGQAKSCPNFFHVY